MTNGNKFKRSKYFASDWDGYHIDFFDRNNNLIFWSYLSEDCSNKVYPAYFKNYVFFNDSSCYCNKNLLHGVRKYEDSSKNIKFNKGYQVKFNTVLDKFFADKDIYLIYPNQMYVINGKNEFAMKSRYMNNDFYYDNPYPMKSRYEFDDGIIYEGYFNKELQFHGEGTITFPNGDKVVGIFKNDEIDGLATYYYANGSTKKVGSTDIFARYNKVSNKLYDLVEMYVKSTGSSSNTIKQSHSVSNSINNTPSNTKITTSKESPILNKVLKGTKDFGMVLTDFGIYNGFLVNGNPNGFGVVTNSNFTLKGMFENGVPYGYAIIEYKNNVVQYGQYIKGQKNGNFITIMKQDSSRDYLAWLCSFYSDDKLSYGQKELIHYPNKNKASFKYKSYNNGSISKVYIDDTKDKYKFTKSFTNAFYFGNLDKNNKPHHFGTMKWNNNDFYVGEYNEGLRDGYGVYFYGDGSFEICNYYKGKRHGTSLYFIDKKTSYEAVDRHYNDGLLDGYLTRYYSDGNKYTVKYEKGNLK